MIGCNLAGGGGHVTGDNQRIRHIHDAENTERNQQQIEQAGDPGDVQKIAFDGLRLFTAAQLRSQLECDLQFQAAARPSGELTRLIATLQARLLAG